MKVDLAAKTLLAALARTTPVVVEAAWQLVLERKRLGTAPTAHVHDMRGKLSALGLVQAEDVLRPPAATPEPVLIHNDCVVRVHCHLCNKALDLLPPTTEFYARATLGRLKSGLALHNQHADDTECLGVLEPLGIARLSR